jgi:hypothetical protein
MTRRTLLKAFVVVPAAIALSSVPTFGYDRWPRIKVVLKERGLPIATWYRDIPTCGTFSTVELHLSSLDARKIRHWDDLSIEFGATSPCEVSSVDLTAPTPRRRT